MSRKPAERGYYCMVDFFQSFGKGDNKSIILKITTDRSAFKSEDSESFYCCLKGVKHLYTRVWLMARIIPYGLHVRPTLHGGSHMQGPLLM